jgi:hexosaminidase
MIDTARHFLTLPTIFAMLDAMSYNKLNVLHWHLVDDQSFPYVSSVYPLLAQKGAFPPWDEHVYAPADVQSVIQYAYLRGIRVIPEFDTPGHFTSWTQGYPQLGTQCSVCCGVPVNPISNFTYEFMTNFFGEVAEVFPDDYVHLGGDELSYDCWANNTAILNFMKQRGWGTNYSLLETYYEKNLLGIVGVDDRRYIIWQDVFDNQVTLNPNTIVGVWKGPLANWQSEMQRVTAQGFQAVLYAPWYLNYISYGQDWIGYYQTDPDDWQGTPQQKALLIGGTACFWAEFIDSTNLVAEAWPRASAVAERFWSPASVNDVTSAQARINAWRCLLIRRGIPAEPADVAVPCPTEFVPVYVPPWDR